MSVEVSKVRVLWHVCVVDDGLGFEGYGVLTIGDGSGPDWPICFRDCTGQGPYFEVTLVRLGFGVDGARWRLAVQLHIVRSVDRVVSSWPFDLGYSFLWRVSRS